MAGPIEYGPPIPLALAKRVAERAEAEAAANGWAMVIAIVDSAGHLVLLHKMEHAQFGSIAIAEGKARTSVNFKRPTKAFEETLAAGGLGLRVL
ncbi:MAG TPA: heme-binding protein, partial [Dongiaceae bacterium]|nr:heme-binding protein [Dongiaceae bacterium]